MRNSILIIVLLLTNPALSIAGGPIHGGKAAGMGTAFIAVADDPSAILFNAAGIAQLKGTNIYGGSPFYCRNQNMKVSQAHQRRPSLMCSSYQIYI